MAVVKDYLLYLSMAPQIIGPVLVNQTRVRRLSPPPKPKSNLKGCSRSGWRPGWSNESPARGVINTGLPCPSPPTRERHQDTDQPPTRPPTPACRTPCTRPQPPRLGLCGRADADPMVVTILGVIALGSLILPPGISRKLTFTCSCSSVDSLPLVPCHHPGPGSAGSRPSAIATVAPPWGTAALLRPRPCP